MQISMPLPMELKKTLRDVIDFEKKQDDKYYYSSKNCKFYKELKRDMKNKHTIYQWRRVYVRENKSNLVPTLTANMGTGGHNVPLILTDDNKIRKLTPRECFRVQGFPKNLCFQNKATLDCISRLETVLLFLLIKRIADKYRFSSKRT